MNGENAVQLLERIGHIRTQDGVVPLTLFPWQKDFVGRAVNEERLTVLKSRDIGASTITVCLYTMLSILLGGDMVIASYKKDSAKSLFKVADGFIELLPDVAPFAQYRRCKVDTDYHKVLWNDATITAMEMSETVGRSFRAKRLLASELAFWANPRESWQAITGSGVAGMSIVAESTPNPMPQGDLFDSLLDSPDWGHVEQDWHGNPAHTDEWARQKLADLDGDKARFAQEYECSRSKASSAQAVIPLSAIDAAMHHTPEPLGLPHALGVDVARFGRDNSVISIRNGKTLVRQDIIHGMDTMTLAKRVRDIAAEDQSEAVNVDVIGIGAGVVDALNDMGVYGVHGINVAEPAWDSEKFANRKSELWWAARDRFLNGDIICPDDRDLKRDLTCTYHYTTAGKIAIQSKEEVSALLGHSPDRGDSLILAFAPVQGLMV